MVPRCSAGSTAPCTSYSRRRGRRSWAAPPRPPPCPTWVDLERGSRRRNARSARPGSCRRLREVTGRLIGDTDQSYSSLRKGGEADWNPGRMCRSEEELVCALPLYAASPDSQPKSNISVRVETAREKSCSLQGSGYLLPPV